MNWAKRSPLFKRNYGVMSTIIESVVLGLYIPIILFSALACWLYLSRWLIPAWRHHELSVDKHAIGIAAVFALLAHLSENLWYGAIRWFDRWDYLNNRLLGVGAWKVLVLASCVFAVAALDDSVRDWRGLLRIFKLVMLTWFFGAVLAQCWRCS